MCLNELCEYKVYLDDILSDLKKQIHQSKLDYHERGICSEKSWFIKINSLKKKVGSKIAQCNLFMQQKKMEKENDFLSCFYSCACDFLPEEIFLQIQKCAKEKQSTFHEPSSS